MVLAAGRAADLISARFLARRAVPEPDQAWSTAGSKLHGSLTEPNLR
jgi:hypothetical protein